MPPFAVEVRNRVLGSLPAEPDASPLLVQLADERISVRNLIRRAVEEQVRELQVRRKLNAVRVREVLDRQFLTPAEIAAQADQGAVRYPSGQGRSATIDVEAEVEKALRGFERGAFRVMADGKHAENLDDVVRFAPGSRVTFLRLTPLVGG